MALWCFSQGIDEHGAGLLVVIDHSLFESGAPCGLIGPFGIAYEAAIGVAMQARTIRTIATRNFRCAPPPCFAKLVFLAGMHSPPRSEEHTSELKSLMRITYAVL